MLSKDKVFKFMRKLKAYKKINLSDKNTQIRIFIVIFKENFFKNYTEKIY